MTEQTKPMSEPMTDGQIEMLAFRHYYPGKVGTVFDAIREALRLKGEAMRKEARQVIEPLLDKYRRNFYMNGGKAEDFAGETKYHRAKRFIAPPKPQP